MDLTRFRAVIFDFDGVIVDSETMQARAWTQIAHDLGLRDRTITAGDIAGRLDVELAGELFPGRDARRCAAAKARVEAEMEACGGPTLVGGIDRLVRRLARTHLLAVCSSGQRDVLARRLSRTGLGDAFRVVVGRAEGVPHKPAPDLYLRALTDLGVAARDACAVEDSAVGVAAAKAAAIHAIQLVHPNMPRCAEADEWLDVPDLPYVDT